MSCMLMPCNNWKWQCSGTPAANCIEVLASGLPSSSQQPVGRVRPAPPLITAPKAFTRMPPAPPPVVVSILGVTDDEPEEVTVTSEGPATKKRRITPTASRAFYFFIGTFDT